MVEDRGAEEALAVGGLCEGGPDVGVAVAGDLRGIVVSACKSSLSPSCYM